MALRKKPVVVPSNAPYIPPSVPQEIVYALKGLNGGEADKGQQTLALRWIIEILCGTYDLPYRPGASDDTAFAAGKMFCGQQLVRLINMPQDVVSQLPKLRAGPGDSDDELPNA